MRQVIKHIMLILISFVFIVGLVTYFTADVYAMGWGSDINEITISFNPNNSTYNKYGYKYQSDATGSMQELVITDSWENWSGVELTSCSFTRTGYSFEEWNTKADGTGEAFSDKEKVKYSDLEDYGDTVILYAIWKCNHASYGWKPDNVNDDGSGTHSKYCIGCGVKSGNSTEIAQDHLYDDGEFVSAPTCTASGITKYTCTLCNLKVDMEIPETGHDWAEVIEEPTANEPGILKRTCKTCDKYEELILEANTWTCTKTGYYYVTVFGSNFNSSYRKKHNTLDSNRSEPAQRYKNVAYIKSGTVVNIGRLDAKYKSSYGKCKHGHEHGCEGRGGAACYIKIEETTLVQAKGYKLNISSKCSHFPSTGGTVNSYTDNIAPVSVKGKFEWMNSDIYNECRNFNGVWNGVTYSEVWEDYNNKTPTATFDFIRPASSLTVKPVTTGLTPATWNNNTVNKSYVAGETFFKEFDSTGITFKVQEPIRPGYDFDKWKFTAQGDIKGYYNDLIKVYTSGDDEDYLDAQWIRHVDTKYTVKHWQMNLDGSTYVLHETEVFEGPTDTSVTPEAKEYEGFTYSHSTSTGYNNTSTANGILATVNIDGNGERVVNYYYTRNTYTQIIKVLKIGGNGITTDYGIMFEKECYYEEEIAWEMVPDTGYYMNYNEVYFADDFGHDKEDWVYDINLGKEYDDWYNTKFKEQQLYNGTGDKFSIYTYSQEFEKDTTKYRYIVNAQDRESVVYMYPNRYAVIYNGNKNWNTEQQKYIQIFMYDKSETLLANKFTRDISDIGAVIDGHVMEQKYEFIGWAWKDDSTWSKKFSDNQGSEVFNMTVTKDEIIDLYAIWERPLTLIFNMNSGKYQNSTDNVVLNTKIYNDNYKYAFNVTNDETIEKENHWLQQNGFIDAWGSVIHNGLNAKYTKEDADGTKYRFIGWSTNPNAKEPDIDLCVYTSESKISHTIYNDTTLYAVWEPVLNIDFTIQRSLGNLNTELINNVSADATMKNIELGIAIRPGEQAKYESYITGNPETMTVKFDKRITNIYDNNGNWTDKLNPNPSSEGKIVDGIQLTDKHGLNRTISTVGRKYISRKFYVPQYVGTKQAEPSSIDVYKYENNFVITNEDSYYYKYVLGEPEGEQIKIMLYIYLPTQEIEKEDGKIEVKVPTTLDELRSRLKIRIHQ